MWNPDAVNTVVIDKICVRCREGPAVCLLSTRTLWDRNNNWPILLLRLNCLISWSGFKAKKLTVEEENKRGRHWKTGAQQHCKTGWNNSVTWGWSARMKATNSVEEMAKTAICDRVNPVQAAKWDGDNFTHEEGAVYQTCDQRIADLKCWTNQRATRDLSPTGYNPQLNP